MNCLTLAVIGLTAVARAQNFIPIGGGSQTSVNGFGDAFAPSILAPNDPSLTPIHFPGNRPNPVPIFPKTQQAGTPHGTPVDLTFVHKHSYREPFRNDQTVTSYNNPIGAAHPNVPRTLGREWVYVDRSADPTTEEGRKLAEEKAKKTNFMFYGLAAPVEKLHRADEFAPSVQPFRNPWDQWYDRFTEAPLDPYKQALLTATKRPTIVDVPFYAADRGKREAPGQMPPLDAEDFTTTTATSTTDATVSTTAALEESTTAVEESTTAVETTSTAAASTSTTTVSSTTTTTAAAASTTTAAAPAAPVVEFTSTTTTATAAASATAAAPITAPIIKVVAPPVHRILNGTRKATVFRRPSTLHPLPTASTPAPSTGPSIGFRPRHNATRLPPAVATKLRVLNRFNPMRTTVPFVKPTTAAPHPFTSIKLDSAVGAAKKMRVSNTNETATTTTESVPLPRKVLPFRTLSFQRRPFPAGKVRVPLHRPTNSTTAAAAATAKSTTAQPATTASIVRVTAKPATNATAAAKNTTISPSAAVHKPQPKVAALNSTVATSRLLKTHTRPAITATKRPFRIFSRRPLSGATLPAKTPIEVETNNVVASESVGELRTEVTRLISTVVQLQSTVLSQQQRIALLENQLRLRRSAASHASSKRPHQTLASVRKPVRFMSAEGRMVERTLIDIKKRSAQGKVVDSAKLRQRSNIA